MFNIDADLIITSKMIFDAHSDDKKSLQRLELHASLSNL